MGGESWAAEAAEEAAADGADAAQRRRLDEHEQQQPADNEDNDAANAATRSVALETRNNARLFDLGVANQALSAGDVLRLKRAAADGGQVVAALCAASATFAGKTAFAQAKYKKRKARKHAAELVVRKPTGRVLAAAMMDARGPGKMLNLRADSVAIALSLANVGAHARVLVIEAPAMAGVVAACAAERLGGKGAVCAVSLYAAQRGGPLDVVRYMNLTAEERAAVCSATLGELREAQRVVEGVEEVEEEAAAVPAAAAAAAAAPSQPPARQPKAERLRSLLRAGFTGAILADPRVDPTELLEAALPLLGGSTPFCVFHPAAQPLAEAQAAMSRAKRAVMMRLSESWTRTYQVLPGRTHPQMSANGTGGYLLAGVTTAVAGVEGSGAGAAAAARDKGGAATC